MSTGAPGGQLVTRDALYGSKLSLSNNNRDEDHSPSKKFTVDATDGGSNTTIQPNGLVRSSLASHVQAFRFHVTNTDAVAIEAAPNGRAAAAASDADIDMQVATCDGDTSVGQAKTRRRCRFSSRTMSCCCCRRASGVRERRTRLPARPPRRLAPSASHCAAHAHPCGPLQLQLEQLRAFPCHRRRHHSSRRLRRRQRASLPSGLRARERFGGA